MAASFVEGAGAVDLAMGLERAALLDATTSHRDGSSNSAGTAPAVNQDTRLPRVPLLLLLVLPAALAAACVVRHRLCGALPAGSASPPLQLRGLAVEDVLGTCNVSLTSLGSSAAQAIHLPAGWRVACRGPPPDGTAAAGAQDLDLNRCWESLKLQGCYRQHGELTWRRGQQITAQMDEAPRPEEFPMDPLARPSLCERRVLGAAGAGAAEAGLASEWLRSMVTVYVINLPSAVDRWGAVSARLRQLGIKFERIEGVDMGQIGGLGAARAMGLVPQDFDRDLTGVAGTVGCAAAHFRALERALSGTPTPLALVLEDDVLLEEDFAARLRRLLRTEAPCGWDAISLKSRCPYGTCVTPHLAKVWPDGNVPAPCRAGVNLGFHAVLYRVATLRGVLRRLSSAVWRRGCLDVDVAMAAISDEVAYFVVPAVQYPGFLREGSMSSLREQRNAGAAA